MYLYMAKPCTRIKLSFPKCNFMLIKFIEFSVKPLSPVFYGLDEHLLGGTTYTLKCTASYANPAAQITWYLNNSTLTPTQYVVSPFIGYYV